MSDFYKEHQKKIALQEQVFSQIKKFFPGKGTPKTKPEIFQERNGTVVVATNGSTIKKLITPPNVLALNNYDWKNSSLAFMTAPGTEFHADGININLQKGIIDSFTGTWSKGEFKGKLFDGVFEGNYFYGIFVGNYADYKSSPNTFYGAQFVSDKGGILGMPDTTSLSSGQEFNFITIPPGYTLYMKSSTGIESYIYVQKRLDIYTSDFNYEIMDGFKRMTTPKKVTYSWSNFRSIWHTGAMTINSSKSMNIANIIQVPEGDSIVDMRLTKSPARGSEASMFVEPVIADYEQDKIYPFNLSDIPNLGITMVKGRVNLKFHSYADYENFNKSVQYAKTDTFAYDLNNIARAIRFGELSDRDLDSFSYLKFVSKNNTTLEEDEIPRYFMDVPGGKPKQMVPAPPKIPQQDPRMSDTNSAYSSAFRVNNFIKNIVPFIVDKDGNQSDVVEYTILNRLKSMFSAKTTAKPSSKPEVKPATSGSKPSNMISKWQHKS